MNNIFSCGKNISFTAQMMGTCLGVRPCSKSLLNHEGHEEHEGINKS